MEDRTEKIRGVAPHLSVVVPCYNEEEVLPELYKRLIDACESVVGADFEVVFIDDGSTDRTRAMLYELHQKDIRVVVVCLARNHGHQLALSAGLKNARGERIFVLDADLQDPPELLEPMMQRMDEGYDVVYGQRTGRKAETAFKKQSAHVFYRLLNRLVEIDIPKDTGDFRLMTRRVVEALNNMPEVDRFIRGMVSWVGYPQSAFEYHRDERFAGETKYPLRKMMKLAIDAITSFSTLPLAAATTLGFAIAAFAGLFSIYTLVAYFSGNTVDGWATLSILILLIGGVQLILLGVVGEYIGRIYRQAKGRPLYMIDEVLRSTPEVTIERRRGERRQNASHLTQVS